MASLAGLFNRAVVSVLPAVPRSLVWRFSRRYIAGESLDDALRTVADLNQRGMRATLDVLGEDVTKAEEVHTGKDLYLEALAQISRRRLDCNISIKLSQMGLRFDERLCHEVVRELMASAQQHDNFVRIDMEDSSVTSATLAIYRQYRTSYPAGAVIQAYLRRSHEDVATLLAEGPTHLRLCKGIYVEPEAIAFRDREQVRDSYRLLLRQMLEGRIVRVGIATHDPPLIEHAIALIAELKTPPEQYEFQMLLGVAESLRDQLVRAGHPLRVYVPFGRSWHAYSLRRLRENPQIAGHIVRNLFHG
ncbi:MAG: proline dehydrogenase family protein [Planctomycetota bacterium]